MRISTAGLYQQSLGALLKRQSDLAKTQQELTTGNKLTRAADDPSGAAQAQRLDHAVAALDDYARSSDLVENRLRLQEDALTAAGDILNRARELTVQANTAGVSDPDRKLIAAEVRHLRSSLLSVANRGDGNDRALFAGQRDGVVPFTDTAGVVSYAGDDGRNRVDIAPDVALADTDPGSEIFLRPLTGDGVIRATAAASNTGAGVLGETRVTNSTTWAMRDLRLQFTSASTWQVVDSASLVVGSGAYVPGDAITAGGVTTRLSGTPAAGDSFTMAPAPRQDVFATLEKLANALEAPATTSTQRAGLSNALAGTLSDLATAQDHFLGFRASTGARLATIASTAENRGAMDLSLRSTLSGLRDVDYAEASTRLSLQMTAIEAAQRTMVRVQSLSLFDKI